MLEGCECLYPVLRHVNYPTDPSVCELERTVFTHTERTVQEAVPESMVLTSGHYSFYLNLPEAASNKVGSRDWSAFTASGSVLA